VSSARLGRRALLTAISGLIAAHAAPRLTPALAADNGVTPEEAFRRLVEGNTRFVTGTSALTPREPAHQHQPTPFAAVLACADARLAPEFLFDQDPGALYVLRTAGALADAPTVGALEFAIETFAIPLIVVLGHDRCDTLRATIDAVQTGLTPAGQIGAVIEALRPAVQLARLRAQLAALRQPPDPPLDLHQEALRAHVASVVERLRRAEPVIAPRLQRDRLRVVGLRADSTRGGVTIVA
jgi:carbonic anhydrase